MKKDLIIKYSLLILSLACFTFQAGARDVYVTASGGASSGDGTADAPVSLSRFITILSSHRVSTDGTELNVYFAGGTYNISSALTFISSSVNTNLNELEVLFSKIEGDEGEVIFSGTGTSTSKFLTIPGLGSSYSMNVRIENVTIKDFVTTANSSSGSSSLFSVGAYTTLELDNVIISNIQSRQLPLMHIATNASVLVSNSKISNIAIPSGTNNSIYSSIGTGTLEFNNCELSGWSLNNASVFAITTGSSSLIMDDVQVKEFNLSSYFISGATTGTQAASILLNNLSFTNSTFSSYIFYPYNSTIFSLTNFEFSNNSTAASLFYSSNSSTNATISNVKIRNNQITGSNPFFHFNNATSVTFENLEVEGNKFSNPVITTGNANVNLKLSSSKFVDNEISSSAAGTGILINGSAHGVITIEESIFDNNRGTGNNQHLINAASAGVITLHTSTFSNNSLSGTGNRYILNLSNSTGNSRLIYNNTFSGNISSTATLNLPRVTTGGVYNNTFFNNGGGIALGNNANLVKNNLLIESGTISGITTAGNWNSVQRNIWNSTFYESGQTAKEAIPNVSQYIEPLQEYESGKPKIHPLQFVAGYNPMVQKGGTKADLGTYGDLLYYDQRGMLRPENMSIGSWDMKVFSVESPGLYNGIYDPDDIFTGFQVDLSRYISIYPEGADAGSVTYTIHTVPAELIESSSQNNQYFDFMTFTGEDGFPRQELVGKFYEMEYGVSYNYNGILLTETITLRIRILGKSNSLGIIDPSVIKCYRAMEQVEFVARYKFISSDQGAGSSATGYPNVPGTANKYHGFSIALVGDLDGDGKPEIVALGMGNRTGLVQRGEYICILNGQTGKEIVRYELPGGTWNLIYTGNHGSPCAMVLVDSDRNGKAEIIVAFGNNTDSNYNRRLISFEVNENTFKDRETGYDKTNKNKLSLKWTNNAYGTSSTNYTTSTANASVKVIPQVADIDGDGIPEILVGHKIYSALTGEELLVLDENYMGRDLGSHVGDQYIPFAYIYDVDMDGKYDIAAGGKLYYDINFTNKTYKTIVMSGIGDGHTAVADINGDGIPEIIVSGGRNPNLIQVWNPGFFEIDAQTGKRTRVNKAPEIIARSSSPQGGMGTGSHSYIYIGDIDGRKDVNTGKKLPEISILGGTWYNGTPVPVHPNIKALGGNPFNLDASGYLVYGSGRAGSLISFTWDESANSIDEKLKVSFVLKHNDTSINTGFTLFDFNNDGVQQICYRDERTLRIISAKKPHYDVGESVDMSTSVRSWTGFEYPVIADIDGDGSADMIVMGHSYNGNQAYGYVYAVESESGDFAPAPMVWNQFMYDPLKINEDLTTPLVAIHPLSDQLAFVKEHEEDYGPQYIYNNTVSQAVKSAVFDGVLKPIVPTPDAIVDGKIEATARKMIIEIRNTGNATLNSNTPMRIYREKVQARDSQGNGLVETLNGQAVRQTIGGDVFVGDTFRIEIPMAESELWDTYIVRITDPSEVVSGVLQDEFVAYASYYDCNYTDNFTEIATFTLRADPATTLGYGSVIIDVFENDVLPENFDGVLRPSMIEAVTTGDVGSWSIVNNKFYYTAPVSHPDGIIEFTYEVEETQTNKIKYGHIYILILEPETRGMSACKGGSYQVKLKEIPQGISFKWYDDAELTDELGENDLNLTNLINDRTLYAKPDMKAVTNPDHNILNFPAAPVTVRVLPDDESLTLKWTGVVNTDWYHTGNWVHLENGQENPVEWTPTTCVNVILPSGCPNYPILTSDAFCKNITLKDRAMIAQLHRLVHYENASVELALTSTERERFVMLSAPLKNMYSGDYHFKKEGKPNWGDVYMTYFQAGNPDFPGSLAQANAFTASFGSVFEKLDLGKPFNLKVVNRSSDASFSFPMADNSYTDENNKTESLTRTDRTRFITDGDLQNDGSLTLPVFNDHANSKLLQIVNPFPAYLDANAFLLANSGKLERHYKVWDGQTESSFVTIQADSIPGEYASARYIIDNPDAISWETTGYIPPFQSFLVMKADGVTTVANVSMNATMTTTLGGSYELRATNTTKNTLWIKARSQDGSNGTALYYSPEAVPNYLPEEDARKLFNDESAVSIYTLSPAQDALAINASGDFSQEVFVGLRLKSAGRITLSFDGLSGFSHEVYLIDNEEDKVYDLASQQEFTFDIEGYSTGNFIELNNRFSLRMEYVPTGVQDISKDGITVYSRGGNLYVTSDWEEIRNLKVYNIKGQLVYSSSKKSTEYKIPLPANQIYIIRGETGSTMHIKKSVVQ